MEIYDISRTIRKGMPVWPGDQRFLHRPTMRISAGDPCNVNAVTMSIHTGTHVDAPYHFDDSGSDIVGVPLRNCIGPARVIELPVEPAISSADLSPLEWLGVERVLVKTRAGESAADGFERDFVYFSAEAAEFLGSLNVLLIGTDAPSVDAFVSKTMPVHRILLKHNVTILEDICLAGVPPGDYELICLPLKFAGLDGSPVRAILRR